ncbi:MAG: peptidoglycan DD-metalloendopeptidase family protein [candidate division WS1 bacterium]|jgi:murein DD-endopeptidase MepM/ murein hydrolase activator NlpD|nr:peptidoglycan DD-metalloendopeptidase family protein [candidate division WS1 bacterium]
MRTIHVARFVLLTGLCLMLGTTALHDAEAKSARQRLQEILGRQRQVQGQLKEIKSEQAEARSELAVARNKAQTARDKADEARRRLEEVNSVLREVKADLVQTEEELGGHRDAMSSRLRALYEAGQPSYVEVVLNATSFEDFTNRAEFSRLIAQQDQGLLNLLVETQEKLAQQRATLEARQAEAEDLKQEAERQKRAAEAAESQAEALSARLAKDRTSAEQALAELEAAENELAAIVRREGSSSSSARGGYSGTSSGRYSWPCPGRLTSPYGWRIHPIYRSRRFHNGIDIAAPAGTPIKACDDGKVIRAGWMGATGKTVVIDHGGGWATSYGHCSKIYVSAGQIVSKGQTIAGVGTTGLSTGNHLHWMVYRNGQHVNPLR